MRPTYTLRIGQLSCSDSSPTGGPTEVLVDRDIDIPIDIARIRLTDRSDVGVEDSVTLDLGLDETPTRVFTGEIVHIEARVDGTLVVAAGSMRTLVDLHVAKVWSDSSIGTITRDLADQAGLTTASVDDGPTLPRFAVDLHRGAHAQLRDLAESFGLELYADRNGALVLRAISGGGAVGGLTGSLGSNAVSVVEGAVGEGSGALRYGANVIEARSSHRPAGWDAVVVGGQSPSSTRGESASDWLTTDDQVARGESGSGDRRALALVPVARTKDLARAVADGILAYSGRASHVVKVRTPGRADLDIGDDVSLTSMPDDDLAGSGRVRALRHRLDAHEGFTTIVTAGLAAGAGIGRGVMP